MRRDLLIAIGALTMSLMVFRLWGPLLLYGEVHGYEPGLVVRILEAVPMIAVLVLSLERIGAWFWRYYAQRFEEAKRG